MEKIAHLAMITTLVAFGAACQSSPQDSPPAESPDEAEEPGEVETIPENNGKINDHKQLDRDGECPPAKKHDKICPQVITWALTEEGICCMYPTPCDVPKGLETFSSTEECEEYAP